MDAWAGRYGFNNGRIQRASGGPHRKSEFLYGLELEFCDMLFAVVCSSGFLAPSGLHRLVLRKGVAYGNESRT